MGGSRMEAGRTRHCACSAQQTSRRDQAWFINTRGENCSGKRSRPSPTVIWRGSLIHQQVSVLLLFNVLMNPGWHSGAWGRAPSSRPWWMALLFTLVWAWHRDSRAYAVPGCDRDLRESRQASWGLLQVKERLVLEAGGIADYLHAAAGG